MAMIEEASVDDNPYLQKTWLLDEKWNEVNDSWNSLKEKIIEYRKLDNELNGNDRDDAWYFGFMIANIEWTGNSYSLKESLEDGMSDGYRYKKFIDNLRSK